MMNEIYKILFAGCFYAVSSYVVGLFELEDKIVDSFFFAYVLGAVCFMILSNIDVWLGG